MIQLKRLQVVDIESSDSVKFLHKIFEQMKESMKALVVG